MLRYILMSVTADAKSAGCPDETGPNATCANHMLESSTAQVAWPLCRAVHLHLCILEAIDSHCIDQAGLPCPEPVNKVSKRVCFKYVHPVAAMPCRVLQYETVYLLPVVDTSM